jgi:hypothetical protein
MVAWMTGDRAGDFFPKKMSSMIRMMTTNRIRPSPEISGSPYSPRMEPYEAGRGAESVVVYSLTAARRMIEARGGMCDR